MFLKYLFSPSHFLQYPWRRARSPESSEAACSSPLPASPPTLPRSLCSASLATWRVLPRATLLAAPPPAGLVPLLWVSALASQQLSPLAQAASCLDLSLVTPIYSSALSSFLTKRNSPLTVPMFLSLFARHPVSIGRGCPLGPLLGPILTAHHFLHRCSVRTYSPSWSST